MKKFCTSLREHVKNINDFEKKKILPLTKEELKSHQNVKVCCICGKIMLEKALYTGKCRGAAHSICNLKFNVPNEISVVFHWTFSAPVEKEVTNIHKDGNESVVAICYKIKFIDSSRFMASLLSNLIDSFAEGILKINWKWHDCFLEYESVKENLIKYKYLTWIIEIFRKKMTKNYDINK